MIEKKRIAALVKQATAEGIEGDLGAVLEKAITVGDLMEVLKTFDPGTPVEVEIPVEIDDSEDMISEVGFVIDFFKSSADDKATEVLTLRACKPDLLEAFLDWEQSQEAEDESQH